MKELSLEYKSLFPSNLSGGEANRDVLSIYDK